MLRRVALLVVLALLPATVAQADVITVGGPVPGVALWSGIQPQSTPSVPGTNATAPPAGRTAKAKAPKPYQIPKVTWPSGTAQVALSPAARQAGSLPIALAGADSTSAAAGSASVTFASRAAAQAAGINGVIVTLARGDGRSTPSPTKVSLNYAAFSGAYGGGYADRLALVLLPACALSTPRLATCRARTPVRFTNDVKAGTLTAVVPVGGGSAGPSTVLAADSTASGSVGTYAATSLSPSGAWSAGGNSGAFTYSYPVTVPPSSAGSAPNVTLSYDSGSVDGRTSATNSQASWLGDGWDYTPGYIERSYQPCSQDGITNSGDLCWGGNILSLSLGAHSGALVRDSGGAWKLQEDDGTQVIPLAGANNGAWQGEAWEIVTPDGTRSYFGENHLPGGNGSDAATGSAWTEPVYCPISHDGPTYLAGSPSCNAAGSGSNSFVANMAWRWNLDYVVDPHGNLRTMTWVSETNYYDRGAGQGNGTNTGYTRGGYLRQIGYGYRLSDATAGTQPVDTVTFNVAERCNPGYANCDYSYLTSNLTNTAVTSNWPDVPADQICPTQSGACANDTPTFFTTKLLSSITTTVRVGATAHTVDTYAFTQMFPSPQAGVVSSSVSADQGDGTVAVLWLASITRTGNDTLGGGSSAGTKPITFLAEMMQNRVDGNSTGSAALYRPRMDSITTEAGAQIAVSYYLGASQSCSRVNHVLPSSSDQDTLYCFAQYWVQTNGTGPVLDWFNIYPVAEVTVSDGVTPAAWSEQQVTQYSYAGAAWHRDDSPLTPDAQRTWNQFRGFRTVTVTSGVAGVEDVPTQNVTTYLQGMDGDYLADGTRRSVGVPDTVGDNVTDSNWLRGRALETDTDLGASTTIEKKSVNGPWVYTTTATETMADSMPALTAQLPRSNETRSYQLWHDGTWRSTRTDSAYDTSGRPVTVDAKGDGTSAVPEVCTTTGYANSTSSVPNMLAYADEVKSVQGPCGTTATASNTVSDTLAFYDNSSTLGALSNAGDITRTQALGSYDSGGTPRYVTQSATQYDGYGRVSSISDADNNTTTTAYSSPGASPDTVTVTNPLGWSSSSTLDPARAMVIASTDVNGELTTKTYDGLGRLTAVWSPLHAQASNAPADQTYSYAVSNTAPSTVTTQTLRDDGSYTPTVDIYDASLRLIQVQAHTTDNEPGRLITDTHYNSLGQSVKVTDADYNADTGPSTTLFQVANDSVVPRESETFYDGLGRTTRLLTVAHGINQYATTTAYGGLDQTDVSPPSGATATSTFADALGRTIASWAYTTSAPTDNAANAAVTTYTYTPAGRTATMKDAVGNIWSWAYDLHGRQVTAVDPGAGTSSTTYDPAGNVASTTDANGNQLTYGYDKLNRKTAEYNTTGGATAGAADQLAALTYDTLAKGRPTAQTRYANGANDATQAYTETIAGYTALYQPTGQSTIIPSAEGNLAGTYSTTAQYTTETSLPAGTRYGGDGGLPREQVNYSYDLADALVAYGGTYTYLDNVDYTPQGQVLQTNFGTSGSQLQRTETYDQATHRLLTTTDALQTMSSSLATTSYTYDQAGLITSDSTRQSGVGTPDTQCYSYDQLGRLTQAFTTTDQVNDPTTGQIQGIGSCADTNPVAGKVTGGPAPYWQTYGYDALGDRVQQTNHDTSVTSTANNTTQTLAYTGYNAATGATTASATPDAVQSVTTTGPKGSTTSSYGYDNAGDTKTRAGQAFTYDAEGRVASAKNTTTGVSATYTYAADGALLIQRDPAANQVIAYLPFGEQLTMNTGNGVVTGQRYYTASPDGVTVVRESSGTVYYELTNALGTATAQVNQSTLGYQFRYFDPYGNQLAGTVQSSWADQHAYLGQPQDPATGLDLLGARHYDPTTGRFLSVDPVLEAGDQRQMNGYAYAADDPVNGADPSGTMTLSGGGGGTYDGTCGSDNTCGSGGSGCRDNGTGPACGGGSGGGCGNGVYADGCAQGTANGDPSGPNPNQYWYNQSQGNYADGCTTRACIANNDRLATDPAYWRMLAEIAAQKAAIANNIEAQQAFQAEQQAATQARANACSGFFGCLAHDAGRLASATVQALAVSAPLFDVIAVLTAGIPVIGEITIGFAVVADLASTIQSGEAVWSDVNSPTASNWKTALDATSTFVGVAGIGLTGVGRVTAARASSAEANLGSALKSRGLEPNTRNMPKSIQPYLQAHHGANGLDNTVTATGLTLSGIGDFSLTGVPYLCGQLCSGQ